VRQKTTGLDQKKYFAPFDAYFFHFLLYLTIVIKEFYKLRWGTGQFATPLDPPMLLANIRKAMAGKWRGQ
jgi:hypothetical protein